MAVRAAAGLFVFCVIVLVGGPDLSPPEEGGLRDSAVRFAPYDSARYEPPPYASDPVLGPQWRQAFRSGIRPPIRTHAVEPVYPEAARQARIEGIVVLEALIGEDGQVIDTRILRSIPLLDQAARDTVEQWHFTPTLVDGRPVKVVQSITVQFALQE